MGGGVRFRAEFDMEEMDCSFCPCFEQDGSYHATCRLSEVLGMPYEMDSVAVPYHNTICQAFCVPIDCPLVPVLDEACRFGVDE